MGLASIVWLTPFLLKGLDQAIQPNPAIKKNEWTAIRTSINLTLTTRTKAGFIIIRTLGKRVEEEDQDGLE
ncbi:hypothetical protein GCM10020370_56020 [Paenibacillus hodogayensis]